MPTLKADPILTTSYDDRFPPEAAFGGDGKKFFSTTGMFPQEILVAFPQYPSGVNLSRIILISTGIKGLKILKCTETNPANFESLVECPLNQPAREGDVQREQFQIPKEGAANGVRFVKIIIESGHAPFITLRSVVFEGETNTA